MSETIRPRPRESGDRAPQKSFRLSANALSQLSFITSSTGWTKTRVVEEAIGLLYRQLIVRLRDGK